MRCQGDGYQSVADIPLVNRIAQARFPKICREKTYFRHVAGREGRGAQASAVGGGRCWGQIPKLQQRRLV